MPMRAFAGGFYDNLRRMYDYLGVKYISPRFIYALSAYSQDEPEGEAASYYIHSSNNHRMPPLRPEGPSLAAWILEICYLALCYYWFTVCCFLVTPKAGDGSGEKDETLREYLKRIRIPQYYSKRYLLPLMSSVTTCTHDALLDFPAIDIVEYERRTYGKPHYTVIGGVHQLQSRLSKGQKVKFGATVTAVENVGTQVQVSWTDAASGQSNSALFDCVLMAVTPNVVGKIFQPLRTAMAVVPTVNVESVIHRDFTRIQSCRQHLSQTLQSTPEPTTASHNFTAPQPIHICSALNSPVTESIHEHPSSVLVSTWPIGPIDPTKVLHRTSFVRVLRTPKSREAVNRIFDVNYPRYSAETDGKQQLWRNGDGNVFLVGGWCWDGMVMLEGCIVSAIRVADSLGVEVPWVVN